MLNNIFFNGNELTFVSLPVHTYVRLFHRKIFIYLFFFSFQIHFHTIYPILSLVINFKLTDTQCLFKWHFLSRNLFNFFFFLHLLFPSSYFTHSIIWENQQEDSMSNITEKKNFRRNEDDISENKENIRCV